MAASEWITADSNGSVKRITSVYSPNYDQKQPNLGFSLAAVPLSLTPLNVPQRAVQRLSTNEYAGIQLAAAAYTDGSTGIYNTASFFEEKEEFQVTPIAEWNDSPNRFKVADDSWIGLDVTASGVFQCTSKGRARYTQLDAQPTDIGESVSTTHTCNLPMNLRHFKASSSGAHFAYGGKEVNLSVWDAERAFGTSASTLTKDDSDSKRKRDRDALFPGEIFRAKNVANDNLDLRQPVDITSLTFLDSSTTQLKSHHDIAIGNTLGAVHRYDTRKGKKPVSSWQDSRMGGGISLVEKGLREHELYIADCATNLWSIDVRKATGPLYAYKGLSGKVTALATDPSSGHIAAASLDRYFRLLSPAATDTGSEKGELAGHGAVVGKLYVTAAPTAIIPLPINLATKKAEDEDRDDDEFEGMQEISEDEEEEVQPRKRRRKE